MCRGTGTCLCGLCPRCFLSDKDRATLAEHGYEINGDFADNMGVLTGAIECSKLSSLEAMDFVEAAEANKKVYAT